ncbi:single-stranded-DNA-specific exonuclease RecJ [Pelodictyon luteolum]|uniref:Single-stranded-DNA-specific exonuclease RecJ n=1 Tax=Chlorobium luteolum (strain DSM 273 / BCRC 81028 / 2530) TaxID=319225 RepID=Q3B5N1_CHLL3|nr:single-stranded-DNA-specific exonuclease RecJ [Pelodictyon luteolum]ABB23350.1 exonuclease RecJ [Pelodictyon luteolum DSM 273]
MKRFRWTILSADDAAVAAMMESINVSAPLARALLNRGIDTFDAARNFFRASFESLHSPLLLGDMEIAVKRVLKAVREGEKIMLYGDYDVDGTTGTAMLHRFLGGLGAEVSWYINDRFQEGYGISPEGIDAAASRGVGLVITVDCGIRANEAVSRARGLGMDVIVCDHHEPDILPEAVAILNPKVPGCRYPFRELCGCGVAFKFIQAIADETGDGEKAWREYLDYVAIATAADMVELTDENRVLVREGLVRIQSAPAMSLQEMFRVMKVAPKEVGMFNIAFGIAPRINAAGRMGSAQRAMEWLLSESAADARLHADGLEELNTLRRQTDADIMEKAEKMLDGHFASYCSSIVLYDESWHIGVLGIVASKMLERHYLPTVIMGGMNGLVKGSVRSVEGLDVYGVLEECGDLLLQFGGHRQAAGVTLLPENLSAFRKRFDAASASRLGIRERQKELVIDSELRLEDAGEKFIRVLEQFSPHGFGNREPVFMTKGLRVHGRPRLLKERHVKFSVRDGSGRFFDVIGFDRRDVYDALQGDSGAVFSMAYSLENRVWNGRAQLQCRLYDLDVSTSIA